MTASGAVQRRAPSRLPSPPSALPSHAALFLDLDGTLADIMPRPQDVGPAPRRADVLARLNALLDGRLAVVSGRLIEDLDRILEGRVAAVAGVHGLMRRGADGCLSHSAPHPDLALARQVLGDLSRDIPGLQFEDKGLSVGLHYRHAPEAAAAVLDAAERLAAGSALVLQRGAMVAELRTPGQNKGLSVAAFLNEEPFLSATPVFVGDDLTDEDGFAMAASLGGYGVLVGPARGTAAAYGLADPSAVLDWLDDVAGRVMA